MVVGTPYELVARADRRIRGRGVAHAGWDILHWEKIIKTVEFIPLAS